MGACRCSRWCIQQIGPRWLSQEGAGRTRLICWVAARSGLRARINAGIDASVADDKKRAQAAPARRHDRADHRGRITELARRVFADLALPKRRAE